MSEESGLNHYRGLSSVIYSNFPKQLGEQLSIVHPPFTIDPLSEFKLNSRFRLNKHQLEAPTDTNAETSEPPAESSDFPPIPLPPIGSHPSKDACVKSVQQFGMQNRFAVASANQYLVQAQDVDEDEEETNETDEPNNAEGTAPTPGPNAAVGP
ncbi:hypothetical protein Pst134EB_012114 [Puccinia striiformis f. sp. tritici]|nr:hypothetical protein Pst134EB_012114 [Puccinia striiformis f. sp. tritici]